MLKVNVSKEVKFRTKTPNMTKTASRSSISSSTQARLKKKITKVGNRLEDYDGFIWPIAITSHSSGGNENDENHFQHLFDMTDNESGSSTGGDVVDITHEMPCPLLGEDWYPQANNLGSAVHEHQDHSMSTSDGNNIPATDMMSMECFKLFIEEHERQVKNLSGGPTSFVEFVKTSLDLIAEYSTTDKLHAIPSASEHEFPSDNHFNFSVEHWKKRVESNKEAINCEMRGRDNEIDKCYVEAEDNKKSQWPPFNVDNCSELFGEEIEVNSCL